MPLESFSEANLAGQHLNNYDVFVHGIQDFSIEKVSQTDDNEFLLEIQIDIECIIKSFIYKSELATMNKKDLSEVTIIDPNWNEHYASAKTEMFIKINIDAIYNTSEKTFSSFEISDISDYNCPYCPDYDDDEEE